MGSSDKVRDFTAFAESNYPGMIIPEMFNDTGNAGDGHPGMQRAIRNWTYWYLHSGNIGSGIHMAGENVTGVNTLYVDNIIGEIDHYGNLSGDVGFSVSGYDTIDARTGLFSKLGGASDITMLDNMLFSDTYHLRGVNQITGINAKITNANITNATHDISFGGVYDIKNAVEITGVSVKITNANITNANITNATQDINFGGSYDIKNAAEITGTTAKITNLSVTTSSLLPIGTVLMYNGSALGGDIATRTNQIGSEGGDTISMPGWYVCNNQSGTPDLLNRFVRCQANVGAKAGSDDAVVVTHGHAGSTAQNAGSHTHGMHDADGVTHRTVLDQFSPWSSPSNIVENAMAAAGDHGHTLTIANSGESGTDKNIPAYYSLIFIVRMS